MFELILLSAILGLCVAATVGAIIALCGEVDDE